MKVNLYEQGGQLQSGGYTIPGMTLTGPLLLSGTVSSPSEAVHKQYVDTAMTNLDAANFVSGTIATARMPAFGGDITTAAGSTVLTLNVSGVIAGDYTKATVDAKGRVTTGLSLTQADLPNLSWSKIVNGLPTTMAGYGILDGVSTANGVITGNLTLAGNPTLANQAATKQYADSNVSSGAKFTTGDIVNLVTGVTPSGFLRCNGGYLSKTTYSTLYAVIGDTFTGSNTQAGNGKPWANQYDINAVQSADITGWAAGTALPGAMCYSTALVTKNRVYLLGGHNGSPTALVYTAPINSDGSLGAWTTATALPVATFDAQAFVTKNRVYFVGGRTGSGDVATTYTAPINTDGTLGTWVAAGNLPGAISQHQVVFTTNRVYLIGGQTSNNYVNTVYTAVVNTDGTLGAWSADTPLPTGLSYARLVVTKNRIYLLGGITGNTTSQSYSNVIYTAAINTDGTLGTWAAAGTMSATITYPALVSTKNAVYLMGGSVGGSYASAVFKATINVDGTLGAFVQGTSLPATLSFSQAIATSSRVFLLGGYNGSAYVGTVYNASFSGGLNDYSAYYNGNITPVDTSLFKLPDYSSYEKTSYYFYIKT